MKGTNMNVKHVLKDGRKVETVKGHRLKKEKTEQIELIIMEVNKREKKSN